MKLIVGLGNPGPQYAYNRHNVGYRLLEGLAKSHGLVFSRQQFRAMIASGYLDRHRVILARPLTFMNLSGGAVGSLMHFYRLTPADLLVAYDDLDLPLGRIRLRARGGSGGHKGVQSIIERLGTNEFARLRIGIGRPSAGDAVGYVLGNFAEEELVMLSRALDLAVEAVGLWLDEGIEAAMNQFNQAPDPQMKVDS